MCPRRRQLFPESGSSEPLPYGGSGDVSFVVPVAGAAMKIKRRQFLHLAAGAVALPAVSGIARAQSYPARPVRLIVGFAAGGANDIIASPFFSPYHFTAGRFCEAPYPRSGGHATPWRQETREALVLSGLRGQRRIDLGGPRGDAAWVTRCGGACQAGEARALAAAARRLAAQPQVWAAGHADAIATLMRRTLTRTRAPILSSLRRMVPQVALANGV